MSDPDVAPGPVDESVEVAPKGPGEVAPKAHPAPIPVAVALLVAAVAGAFVAVAAGVARIAQLRLTARRDRAVAAAPEVPQTRS